VHLPASIAALASALALAGLAVGCAPTIGDSCSSSTACSVNNDRVCDLTQPGGACTVFDCQPDRCPDDAVCVRFNPTPPRRAVVACMRRCDGDGSCRTGDGYRCRSTQDLASEALEVEVIDRARPDARFCVAVGE
jgi:hypothetical protein